MRIFLPILALLILSVSIQGCNSPSFNSSDKGLANADSLFLGFYLGLPQKTFYDLCTELNSQKKITQGPGGATSVEHKIKGAFGGDVSMRFYPTFIDKKIYEMPVTYTYESWAPWNKEYSSEALLPKILESYKAIYGDEFKVVNDRYRGMIYYRMDGKRRINLFIKDDQFVQAVFTDMEVEKRLKDEFEKSQNQKSVN
jgi:hypothetical protein|uniref:hypothetical protein n=1 Tax=Algoriphagus sp. TaxID=1872435 RepID=UPI004047C985